MNQATLEPMSDSVNASTLPATTLIICSRNRPQLLEETVESVLRGDQVPAELLIIDQSAARHERLASWGEARGCSIRYEWTPVAGVSRARNIGISLAQHELLVFIDDDMLVEANWFETLVGALLAAGPQAVVTGSVHPAGDTSGGFQFAIKVDPSPAVYKGRVGKDVLMSGHMAAYRSTLTSVAGFDERFGPGALFRSAEDNDLGFRLLEAGYRTVYVPEAIVYHRIWRRAMDQLPLRWSYGIGQGAFYAKYLTWRDRYMLSRLFKDLQYYVRQPMRLLRERRWALGYAVYILGLFFGFARWILTQSKARP